MLDRPVSGIPGLLLLVLAPVACGRTEAPTPHPAEPPQFLNLSPGVAYVGRESCRTCHLDIYSTFLHTGMGRSWYPMSPASAVEDFTDKNEVVDPSNGLRYRMFEREGRYFVRQFVSDARGRELIGDEREFKEVIGSTNHSRQFGTFVGRGFYELPVAWYASTGWDLAPGFHVNNLLFTRELTEECTFCHNALMPALPGERNVYGEPIPAGIDCERCHGPGRLHVEKWSAGAVEPTGNVDPTIVNPRRLPTELRVQVCYQCHLGGSETADRVPRIGRDLFSYRPGQSLLEVVVPLTYAEPLPGRFTITGQADRMVLSRCYRESKGRLECLTCHNPHLTIYRSDRPADYFRQKCLTCHQVKDCSATPDARAATTPPDDCVTCHMRRGEPTDHLHTLFTDHWIRRRIDVDPAETRTDYRFIPLLPATEKILTPGEVEYYRGCASFRRSFQTHDESEQAIHRRNAETAFGDAAKRGFDHAELWYHRGKNLAAMQKWPEAAAALRRALEREPQHHDAAFELASALMRLRRLPEAAATFRRMLEWNPGDEAALGDLGVCQLSLGRPEEALDLFDRAIREDPLRASLHANRGVALAQLNRAKEAAAALEQATRLNPLDARTWQLYGALLQQTGRAEKAAQVLAHARSLASRATGVTGRN